MNNSHTALPPTDIGLTADRLPVHVGKCQEDNIWVPTQRHFCKFHPLTNAASCGSSHDSILVKEKQTSIVGERWRGLFVRQIFFCFVIKLFSRISGCGSKFLDCRVSVLHFYMSHLPCIFVTGFIE